MGNQFMTQLTDKIREAIIGNVGTVISGRIGITDAEQLVKKFSPTFDTDDLAKLPNFQSIASVIINYSTLAMASNATATWRAHRRGAAFASACMVQFHPTALPVSSHWQSKTTLMSESLRNDGRIWVPVRPGDDRPPNDIPEDERDYYLERKYPAFGIEDRKSVV